jgi:hypothetical protein
MIQAARSRRSPSGAQFRGTWVSGALTTPNGSSTGTASAAVFAFQWVSTGIPAPATFTASPYYQTGFSTNLIPKVCMVTQVEVNYMVTTSFTSIQDLSMGMFIVSSFTALGTGGVIATFASSPYGQSFDSSMGISNFATQTAYASGNGAIQMATTANLGTLTGTVAIYPLRVWGGTSGVVGAGIQSSVYPFEVGNDPNTQSIFFRNNQGFTIQPLVTWGAAGVANLYVSVEWIEMPSNYT